MDQFFPRLGDFVARYRWLVIGVWVALFVASIPGVKNVKDSLRSGGFELPDSDSGKGSRVLEDEFGRRTVTTGVLIAFSESMTVDDPRFRDAVVSSADRVSKVEGVRGVISFYSSGQSRFVSPDRKTTYAIINFSADEEQAKKLTPTVRNLLKDQPAGVTAYLMGFPALSYDLAQGSEHDLKTAELTSLPLTLILLLLVFGTILAAGLPLILGAMAVVISLAGIYLTAQRIETSIFAMNTASMIGLGLGIDFSLLMVSRFREELDRGLSSHQAAVNTVATSGRSIVFSGLTVMLGLSVLCLYDLVLIRSIAIGMLLVAGLAMLGAVTLLPALLALFGRRLNAWRLIPSRKRGSGHSGGRWHDWSLLVMRQPWLFLILSVGLLLALAWPARELNAIGSGGARGMAADTETRHGFDRMLNAFGPGEATPITVVVHGTRSNDAWDPEVLGSVHRLVKKIETDPRVQRVESLLLLAPGATEEQFRGLKLEQLQRSPQASVALPAFVNVPRPDGIGSGRSDVHSILVYSRQDELNTETIDLVRDLRDKFIPDSRLPTIVQTNVTGQTALILDYRDKLFKQFPLLVGLVLLITYVVLLLFFHSLILPLKAILMNIVSILASYGVLVLVFQHGVGENLLDFEALGRLSMFSPVILFSILFGLSTDYEVFLLSRVRELYSHSRDNEQSVAVGLERTAGIITAAGLIMIVVFGSFALGQTLVIKELGVGLAVAVLLDSTIIRVIMVPASMKLMGAGNWWMPKFLDWIPQIKEAPDEEPAPAHPRAAPAYGFATAPSHQQTMIFGGRTCPNCRSTIRAGARFCGRCGSQMGASAGRAPGVMAAPRPEARAASVAGGSVRRVPILLTDGRQQRRAWLVLRDCHVEDDPGRKTIPTLQIAGLDLASLAGSEPEIQIRNARIRL